ncbi:hypothetical protein BC834DRAFT_976721 [Gloeopeniophorella convolvens]|nr:hypothetical protein BC834DRAFT_976721 [Gloeopeniophorella convolvens]
MTYKIPPQAQKNSSTQDEAKAGWEPLPSSPLRSPLSSPGLSPPASPTDGFHGCVLANDEHRRINAQMLEPPRVVPFGGRAGVPLTQAERTLYKDARRYYHAYDQGNSYSPFTSEPDWAFAHWAKVRRLSSRAVTDLPSIPGAVEKLGVSFKNARELNKIVDECLPGVHHSSANKSPSRIRHMLFHDMHAGKWRRATQHAAETAASGTAVVPIIISTDKMQITLFRDKTEYPAYMMMGNIPKGI